MTEQTSRLLQNLRRLGVWFVAFVLVLVASSIGLSRIIEKEVPDASLALDPLNVDALVAEIANELNDQNSSPDLDALAAKATSALQFDVGDARLYSLVGEVKYRQGDRIGAYALFGQARILSKTEIHALQRLIGHSVETGDLANAVSEIDTLLRRWPDQFPAIAGGMPVILSNVDGYRSVLAAVAAEAPWRASLFAALRTTPAGLDFANRLLLDLADSAAPPKSDELSAVIGGYIRQKEYESAYQLFLFSLSDQEQQLGGYVFNSTFQPVFSGKPFDWQIRNQPGLEVTFGSAQDSGDGNSGASVQFLNTPVKNASLQQYLELPPGTYRISLIASARNLKLPKDLFWSLRCVDPVGETTRLEIPEGTFQRKSVGQDFSVGSPACRMQLLRLETDTIAESWRFRYAGTLVMHKLSIERLSS